MAARAKKTEAAEAVDETATETVEVCPQKVEKKIRKYMLASMGVALLPAPLLDFAAITALQLKMVHSLSRLYGVPYKENLGRSIIGSLLGSLGAATLAVGVVGSVFKFVPVFGVVAHALTYPILIGAVTHAIGRVFVMHFETGGTLLDFDVDEMREHFRREFEAGKGVAKAAQAEKSE